MDARDKLTPNSLPRTDFSIFIMALREDGIDYSFETGGIRWFICVNDKVYFLTKTQIHREWGVSRTQFNRFEDWCIHQEGRSVLNS